MISKQGAEGVLQRGGGRFVYYHFLFFSYPFSLFFFQVSSIPRRGSVNKTKSKKEKEKTQHWLKPSFNSPTFFSFQFSISRKAFIVPCMRRWGLRI